MAQYSVKQLPSAIIVLIAATVFHVAAKQKAHLTIAPNNEVLFSTPVTLTCRIENFNTDSVQIELKFGSGKYRARLYGSLLAYPKPGDSKYLSSGSCRDFTYPNVQFCAGKSQLSVKFNATSELAGKASCRAIETDVFPAVEKELRVTDVAVQIYPQDSRAGRLVEVMCIFDISSGDKYTAKMTGLEDWRRKPNETGLGLECHTFLFEKVSRVVTEEDNGRKVTCSMGREKKSETLNIRFPPIITVWPDNFATVFVGDTIKCFVAANPPTTRVVLYTKASVGVWDTAHENKGVAQTQYKIPVGTKTGEFKATCTAKSDQHSTSRTFTYRLLSWRLETPNGKIFPTYHGGNFKLTCKLNFAAGESDHSTISVLWLQKRSDKYKQGNKLLAISKSDRDEKTFEPRVQLSVTRESDHIITSVFFSNVNKERDSKRMVYSCLFKNPRGDKLKEEMVVNIVEAPVQLTISPEDKVEQLTPVVLSCLAKTLDASHEQLELQFGSGKYKAMLHGSALLYPKLTDIKQLPPGSCLNFTKPDVTFCAEKSQLSVKFNVTLELAGKESCRVIGTDTVRPVVKELLLIRVGLQIYPQTPKVGQRVEATCIFDIIGNDQAEAKMTGVEDWSKLPDREYDIEPFFRLERSVWRKLKATDNGRNITCTLGGDSLTRSIDIKTFM